MATFDVVQRSERDRPVGRGTVDDQSGIVLFEYLEHDLANVQFDSVEAFEAALRATGRELDIIWP